MDVHMRPRAGKRLFGEALAAGGMEGFVPLIEQFRYAAAAAAAAVVLVKPAGGVPHH